LAQPSTLRATVGVLAALSLVAGCGGGGAGKNTSSIFGRSPTGQAQPTAGGNPTPTPTPTPAPTPGATPAPTPNPLGKLYAVDFRANAIRVFDDPAAKGGAPGTQATDIAPDRVISGAATGLSEPLNADIDPRLDELYVTNRGASPDEVLVFSSASTANGNVGPARRIGLTGDNIRLSIAIDWVRDILYVVRTDNQIGVYERASTINGPATPARTFSFPLTTIAIVRIAVDPLADRLFVPTALNNSVIIVDQASARTGATAVFQPPYREIKGTATGLGNPQGLSFDFQRDEMYVTCRDASPTSGIFVWTGLGAVTGNVAPARRMTGTATGFATPIEGVIHRERDCLYQLNDSATAIRIFAGAMTLNGAVAPARLISGSRTGFSFINDLVLDPTR